MASEKNLYQRILAVAADIRNVEKNLSVDVYGGKSYKAVADYDVVVAVKNAVAKHGILSIPVSQELVEHEIMEYTTSKGDRKTQFVDIVKMTLRLINVDDPSQFLDITTFGRGIDNGDKSFGKASTYARKYGLLNAYKIATGEDPDQQGSEEGQRPDKGAGAVGVLAPGEDKGDHGDRAQELFKCFRFHCVCDVKGLLLSSFPRSSRRGFR